MSFSSEYAALRKKRKKNEEEEASGTSAKTSKKSSFAEQYAELRSKRSSSVAEDDDIAPVRNYGTRLYSNGIYTFALDDIAPVTDDRETYAKTLAYRKFDEQQAMLKLAFKKKLEDEAEKDPANRIEQIREANKGKTQEQIKMESQFSAIAAENEAKKAEEEKKKAFESMIENENNKPAKQGVIRREFEKPMLNWKHSISEQKEAQEEAQEEEKRTWFQAEAFENGYDFGDVTKSVGATLGDIGVNAFQGLASMGEGIIDFSIYAADLTRVKKRPIFYNAQTGEKMDFDEDLREWAQKDVVGDFVAPAKEWLDGASFLGDKSDSVAQGLGQIAGIYLTGGLGEAAGLGSAGATALTTGMMFASSAGSGIGEAYASGASDEQAMAYGVLKGLADAGSELIFGGLGKGVNALGVNRGISSLDDMFAKKLSDGISKQVVKNFVEFGVKSSAEGFEEVLAGLGTAVAQKLTYMSDEELLKLIDDQDLFEQFVIGTVTSALAQSGYIPGMKKGSLRESNTTGRDFITGYTQSEQSVIDRVLEDRISEMEEAGEELSEKDKKKLLEEVQSDVKRGYIDTDKIEEILGGDKYTAWKDADRKESELIEEYEKLADTPSGELSRNQQKRLDELEAQIENLRKKPESTRLRGELSSFLSDQLKNSRLNESYNERVRRREKFVDDLSKYKNEAAKKSIQNLIDTEYANNSNAVHDFADNVAKIAEARNKVISFTTTKLMRDSGQQYRSVKKFSANGSTKVFELETKYVDPEHAPVVKIDGKKVDGYKVDYNTGTIVFEKAPASGEITVEYYDNSIISDGFRTADGITVNLDSPRAWAYIIGHEVTHDIDGTKEYDAYRKAILKWAKNKGDYDVRLNGYKSLYNEDTDFDGEITADLSGKYITSDSEFIADLCNNNKSTAQAVMDKIKHFLSLAKPGSKQARQLERAKQLYAKAWRAAQEASVKESGRVKYSLSVPTSDPDIRFSLTSELDGEPIENERLIRDEYDTQYSLSHSKDIADGQKSYLANQKMRFVSDAELEEAQRVTSAMVEVMMKYSSILPEDKIGKVLTKNGSYDRSVENTTICVRTLAYNEFVDKVQEEIGRPLTQMESFLVSQKLYDIATEPQCLYCYVSLDRKSFNEMLLRYMQDRDTVIAKYNSGDKTPASVDALYQDFLNGRKDTKNMKERFNKWISYADNGTQLLSLADIATDAKQTAINDEGGILAEQLKDARAYAQSASWSKIQKDYVAYKDEILKLGDRVVKNLNEHYGLRWYSFSDYSAAFIVENMQQITDASIRGLKGLSYTKDTDYAEIFAPSGMNINVSVFVKQNANGDFYIDERQSANLEKALQLREQYPNVGIVATVTDDAALRWAGEQEYTDVIIPFHIVRTGTDVAEYYKWLNYTSESGDTILDKSLWDAYLDSLNVSESGRKKVSRNIYPSEHKNDKATYLQLCESRGLSPRFVRYTGEPWYMKLVNETRLSADDTPALKPIFNEDAAKASFEKFVEKGGYEGGWYKEGVDVDAEVKAVADDVLAGRKANEVEYGRQDVDPEALMSGRRANRTHGQHSLSRIGEGVIDQNAHRRLHPLEDLLPVREDVNVQESAKDARSATDEDVMPMPEAEQRIDLKYLMEEDDTLPVRDDVQAANASEAAEDVPITTVRKRLETKKGNYERELESNRANRKQAWDNYDDAIAQAQSEYDGLKNKDTKKANKLLRRIDRLKRQQANVDADYEKRISDLEARIGKTDAELQKDHSKKDRLERAYARIDRELEAKKAELAESYERKRAELESQVSDRSAFISSEAGLLYDELANLRRGVRASTDLGYLLDLGYDWKSLKAALAHAKQSPDSVVNTVSDAESAVRKFLADKYDQKSAELSNIDNAIKNEETQLDTEAEIEREKARRAVQRRTKQDSYRSHIAELIGDTSNWRDKKTGLSYSLNTLARNLRDIVRGADGKQDIETADRIYEDLQGTYNHNEAEMNREATRIKKAFADMKITNHENVYAQMLGELRHNPDTELTAEDVDAYYQKHKNKIDTEKVDRIIDMAREVYDSLLERVNAVLREQGMKEIPYRQGYFPHFTNPKQGFLARLLNWKVKDDSIPTDIAGLTEEFKPNRSWQSFNKQRTTDTTDYNFAQGLDTYVRGALDWIYHIEDIQKYRAFETEIRYQHSDQGIRDAIDKLEQSDQYDADELQEQIDLVYANAKNPLPNLVQNIRTVTNILAGKKNSLDRNMESQLNRKAYSVMTNISSRVNANMVAGSLSAALSNIIPIPQSWAEVNPIRTLQGLWQTVKSYFVNDEMVEKSDFLTNRLRQTENLFKTEWDKATDAVTLPMNAIDNLVSQTVWRSKYYQNLGKGMSEAEAIHDADRFTEGLMAGRSRGNMPTAFDAKNPIAKIFTAFQLEVANTYNYLYKDVPQNVKGRNAAEKFLKLTLGYFGAYYGSYLFNSIFNKLTGRNAAFDPVRIVEELLSDLGFGGDDDDDEKEDSLQKALGNLAENILEETPFIGGWLGGGRIPLNSALPYGGISLDSFNQLMDDIGEGDWSSLTKELINPIYYVALPTGGGQLKKSISGLSMFDELPLVGNLFSGVDLPVSGSYTSTDYYKLDPELIDEYDTLSGIDKEDLTDEQKARLDEIAPTVEDAKAKTKLRYPVEDSWQNVLHALLFGKWANENAQDYFDNDRSGLNVKQTQEYLDSDMTIQEYWDYRDGLKGLSTLEEQADYINSLDIPLWKKNLFINDIAERKEPIDMADYDKYNSFEEFDYAEKYPEKYAFLEKEGIGYEGYKALDEATKASWSWAFKHQKEYQHYKKNGIMPEDYSVYQVSMLDFDDKSNEAYQWEFNYPEKSALAKAAAGGSVKYREYAKALSGIKSDKDADGKVISGSRKEKVFDYIFGLDLEYGQKAILFKSEYPSDDTFNDDIVDYLNGRDDITYSEMKTILEELGATVDGKSIKW